MYFLIIIHGNFFSIASFIYYSPTFESKLLQHVEVKNNLNGVCCVILLSYLQTIWR